MVAYNNSRDFKPRNDQYDRDSRYGSRDSRNSYSKPAPVTEPTPCNATVNMFRYTGKDIVLHQYSVSFTPEIMRKSIFSKFMYVVEQNNFNIPYAFDGVSLLVSNQKFDSVELKVPMRDGELVCRIEYKHSFDSRDNRKDNANLAQCLEIVSRYYQRISFLVDKKKMYNISSRAFDLGNGLEVLPGIASNIKFLDTGICLNLDAAFGVFHKPISVLDLICDVAETRSQRSRGPRVDPLRDDLGSNFYYDLEKVLKNVRVTTTHRERNGSFKVSGLVLTKASDLKFEVDGKSFTVAEYFANTYKPLKYPHLPLVVVKKKDITIHLPLEVLKLCPGQKYNRKLDENMTASMIKIAAKKPFERFELIQNKAKDLAAFNNKVLSEFGMAFDNQMINCKGTILPAPQISFNANKKVFVNNGSWNLIGVNALQGVEIGEWTIFSFRSCDSINDDLIARFVDIASRYGVHFRARPSHCVVRNMSEFFDAKKSKFNLVVLPDKNAQRYEEVKRIAETYGSVYTQCLVASNIVKLSNPSFASNLLLKINAKLGGMNWGIDKKMLKDKSTILIGIDVNHPGVGDLESPSVVSIVGTMDYEFIRYKTIIEHQDRQQEVVVSLKESLKNLLKSHYAATRNKPERIMVFRDGVGDTMFNTIFNKEIEAIKEGCAELDATYKPEVNFVIAQKRHSVRFMSNGNNLVPGTVIDEISTPGVFDFFLVSHHALQGTARPIRYVVVKNESNFSKMDMYEITYNLCHLYARATKSVSVVPPIYYAHLAAERGKAYFEKNQDGAVIMRSCDKDISKTLYYV